MNDFELSYMHHARSRELMAEAERERRAKALGQSRGNPVSRWASGLAKALRRKKNASAKRARRLQPAK